MTNNEKSKRYEKVSYKNLSGIRKDLWTEKYVVQKYIRGDRYSRTFDSLNDAVDWRKNFNPALSYKSINDNKLKQKTKKRILEIEAKLPSNPLKKLNGTELNLTFADVWELYKANHLEKNLEKQSCRRRLRDAIFYTELMHIKMVDFDSNIISQHLVIRVEQSKNNIKSARCNFNNDLKNLKAMFNWYREIYDDFFINPILKKHYKEGFIRKVPKKNKKLKEGHLIEFFNALEEIDPFWRDFAECQFFFSSRVQEPAGLLRSCVDTYDQVVSIENVMVWGDDKKFSYLKLCPKNGEDRIITFNKRIKAIMERRMKDDPKKPWRICPVSGITLELVFHKNGNPLSYRQIQYAYNKALKLIGLFPRFSSTHIMRHSMANLVRSISDLDTAQAVGGWKSRDIVESVYTDTPVHVADKARKDIENLLFSDEDSDDFDPEPIVKNSFGALKLLKS